MKNKIFRTTVLALVSIISYLCLNCKADLNDICIIANKDVPVDALLKKDIKDIYCGIKTEWSNNNKIHFVVLNSPDVYKYFCRNFLNKSVKQYRYFWRNKVFMGTGRLPKTYSSDQDIIKYVAGKKGAVGYISFKTNDEGVKILRLH